MFARGTTHQLRMVLHRARTVGRTSIAAMTIAAATMAAPHAAHAARGDCAQPVTDGSRPGSTDCLYILKAVVGTETCSPTCICTPTGGQIPRASDALICLAAAVGQAVQLSCPCSATTTTTMSPVDCEAPIEECLDNRGPKGNDFRDADGCSADAVIDALGKLGITPDDPEAVKDNPLEFFTNGLCSAPFGNLTDPLAVFDSPR